MTIDEVIAGLAAGLPAESTTRPKRPSLVGLGASGDTRPFDIHRERDGLAARKLSEGAWPARAAGRHNILVAAADTSTPEHERCVKVLDRHDDLVVASPVVVETAWLIESRLGPEAEAAFVNSVATSELRVIDMIEADWARCRDVITQYADLRLGLVDASVVVVAERFRRSRIKPLPREAR